ncbi:MAG: hypothetical protein UW03_C0019G0013 [Candidatus Peregrinibacteria bacterium GW2011_GWA2_43_8]|nr:MAG: hypothetical protein UW03_C0019G0013 [Candidatus Peregrinibacteria bacterium GW2011_GWA2_43_8]
MPHHHTYYFPKTVAAWKKEGMRAVEIIKLKTTVMTEVAGDEKGNVPAGAFIVLASLAMAFNQYLFPYEIMGISYRPGLDSVIVQAILYAVFSAVGIFVLGFIAQKLFKGKAKPCEFFRACGYSSLLGVTGLIPMVGMLAGLWMLVVYFMLLKNVQKLDDGSAVGALVVALIAMVVVGGLCGIVFGGLMMGGMMGYSF